MKKFTTIPEISNFSYRGLLFGAPCIERNIGMAILSISLSVRDTTAKVICQKAASLDGTVLRKRHLADIFYHIRHVAHASRNWSWGCIWDPHFGEGEVLQGEVSGGSI